MTTQHTPAPWFVGEPFKPGHEGPDVISVYARGEVVAHVNCAFGRGPDNAKLIGAAPVLAHQLANAVAVIETFINQARADAKQLKYSIHGRKLADLADGARFHVDEAIAALTKAGIL